jgi:hypothetical protein
MRVNRAVAVEKVWPLRWMRYQRAMKMSYFT